MRYIDFLQRRMMAASAPPDTHNYSLDYLTFDVLTSGNVSWLYGGTSAGKKTISYRKNGGSWTSWTAGSSAVAVVAGDKMEFKGTNAAYHTGNDQVNSYFNTTCNINIKGNIMSLISGDSFTSSKTLSTNYALSHIFRQARVVSAENLILPATTLSSYCYRRMFENRTTLKKAPKLLPATTLKQNCYADMFYGCTALETSPVLPALTLVTSCYYTMFYNCKKLKNITCLATSISASSCLSSWVYGVAAGGVFTKNRNMSSWPSGTSGIPSSWTIRDL